MEGRADLALPLLPVARGAVLPVERGPGGPGTLAVRGLDHRDPSRLRDQVDLKDHADSQGQGQSHNDKAHVVLWRAHYHLSPGRKPGKDRTSAGRSAARFRPPTRPPRPGGERDPTAWE